MTVEIDMEYIAKNVSDVQKFLELCPNPTCSDIGKMLAVQAGVLQAEGLLLMQDARLLPGAAKIRRVALAADLLRAAAESFLGADRILSRVEGAALEYRRAVEARRIANDELLESLARAGLLVSDVGVDGTLEVVGRVDPFGGAIEVKQKRRSRRQKLGLELGPESFLLSQ